MNATPHPPQLAGYEPIRFLGAGGFADVFLYRQPILQRLVAIKIPRRSASQELRDDFAIEASLMARVATHPAVPSLIELGNHVDGRAYIAMEYCPVADLGNRVRSEPLSLAETLHYIIHVGGAVEMLHRMGIVHRDIKPGNILLTTYGTPVLTDFGIATHQGTTAQGRAREGFSAPWAAPEQHVAGALAQPAADIYSLCATAWSFLTGRSPYEVPGGDNTPLALAQRVQKGVLPPLPLPGAPASLHAVLRKGLAKRPEDRFSTVMELAKALQAIQTEIGQPHTPITVLTDVDAHESLALDDAEAGVTVVRRPRVLGSEAPGFADFVAPPPSPARSETENRTVVARRPALGAQPGQSVRAGNPNVPAWSGIGGPQPARSSLSSPAPPARPASKWAIGAGVALVLVGVIALIASLRGQPGTITELPTQAPTQAQDPVPLHLPPVTGLRVVIADGQVEATWDYHVAVPHTFLYEAEGEGLPSVAEETSDKRVTFAAPPGQICVVVTARASDGRSSESRKACVNN